jgi:hypothetical protein
MLIMKPKKLNAKALNTKTYVFAIRAENMKLNQLKHVDWYSYRVLAYYESMMGLPWYIREKKWFGY